MISFKGALININAISDTHGRLENCAAAYQTFVDNQKDMFVPSKAGSENILMVNGDWFMAGGTRGYLSNPNAASQDYQLQFFNKFTGELKKIAENLRTYFVIGNHDQDAGVKKLSETLSSLNADATISTNLDRAKSPALLENIRKNELVKSKIVDISDDKDPQKKHKMLILGLSPVNASYYNKKTDGITFIDDVKKPQIEVMPEDYEKTLEVMDEEVRKFKAENSNGVVVIMSHCGSGVASAFAQKNGNVDLILEGHIHEDFETQENGTTIVGLTKDFKKIENIKITLDDDGNILGKPKLTKYEPETKKSHHNEMDRYFKDIFKADLKKTFFIDACCNLTELDTKNVRKENSHLANFVTDVILSEIQKHDPSVEIFGINASAIRKELPTSKKGPANRLDLMFVLNGLKPDSAGIFVNEISGKELVKIIASNLKFNAQDDEKNPIMHYSGLIVDKHLANQDTDSMSPEELRHFVIEEKTGRPINLKKKYKIANTEKWLLKSDYSNIERLRKEAVALPCANARELFMGHFENLWEQEKFDTHIYAQKSDRIIDTSALPQS